MKNRPLVFVVDDDNAARDGLAMVIETVGFPCQTFDSAEGFLEHYKEGTPGCLVLDMNMPGMNGDELQEELNRRNVALPIIFLTAYGDIPTTVRTIKAGAVDFMTKPVQVNLLIDRIQDILQQQEQMLDQSERDYELHKRLSSLTPRESEVLPLAIAGIPNKEIARQLGISFRTVELYRTQILRKTGVNNFLELARLCESSRITLEPKNDNQ